MLTSNVVDHGFESWLSQTKDYRISICYTPAPLEGGVYCFTSVLPSVQDIFRHIFLSNYWWQKSDIWSQASYRYTILWEAFLDPSDSYFLFADLIGFYTHWTYMRGYHKWALAHSSSCFYFTEHAALRRKSKDWLARN
jgi:hypothetical protein